MAGIQMRGGLAAIAALSTAAAVHAGPGPTPLYVDAAAPAGGNGSSWSQSFRDLQDALALAKLDPNPAKQYDIRVAQGIYTPDRGTGNRAMTFLVASGMTLSGGYAGIAATNPDQRDPSQFVSVLSGDLGHNDGPGFANTGENSQIVLLIEPVRFPLSGPPDIFIDGLVISGANSVGTLFNAGAVTVVSSNKTVWMSRCVIRDSQSRVGGGIVSYNILRMDRCTVTGNRATEYGGGILCSELTISNSEISRNSAGVDGGGIRGSRITITDCLIANNAADKDGGGIAGSGNFERCMIVGNTAGRNGGGLWIYTDVTKLASCLIAHNSAVAGGGIHLDAGTLQINNGTIVNNTATSQSGATNFGVESVLVEADNSIFARNTAPIGPLARITIGFMTLRRCLVRGGSATVTPISRLTYQNDNFDADPGFVNSTGISSAPNAWQDKDYRLLPFSPCVDSGKLLFFPIDTAIDVAGHPRFTDILVTPNTGSGSTTYLDLGAYETQPACAADFDGSGQVTIDDLFWFFSLYFIGDAAADVDGVNGVALDDLFFFINAWFTGC